MRRIIYIVSLMMVVACVKHGAENSPESRLDIEADIARSADSKAIIEGNVFKTGNTMGIFVYHSETENVQTPSPMFHFELYGSRYKNIRASYNESTPSKPWRFNFESASTMFDDIYLIRPTVAAYETGLSVVAYAPWIANVQSITEVPFYLGGHSEDMVDLMWARQNTHDSSVNPTDAGKNYKIIPDGNAQPVKLTFQHALSLLKIGFRCKYEGSVITVSSIKLKKKDDGTTPLVISGKFNAMTGTVSESATSFYLSYDYTGEAYVFQYSEDDYLYVPMLIFPQEYKADGDYILEFQFNGHDLAAEYEIRLSDVAGGFRAGNVYTFNFTLDNYIQFDGVQVSDEWIESDLNNKELKF